MTKHAIVGKEREVMSLGGQLDLGQRHCAVTGLQWGDEGKGKIVDLLTERFDVVVRYNGGANAGHSVQVGDDRYALHLIPSGILYPDKVNVLGNGLVIDPAKLIEEIDQLGNRGIKFGDNLRISDRAHVVFPYHKTQDSLFESAVSVARGESAKIGTTGRGIGPCYADKAQRSTAIRMGELLDASALEEKLRYVVAVKNVILEALAQQCGESFSPFDPAELARQYAQMGDRLRPYVCDTAQLLADAAGSGQKVLFEGANATLLDIDHGTYPYVTSSSCSALGVHAGAGVPGRQVEQVIGVAKAYSTRVGGGPMPTELKDATGDLIRKRGKEYGTTTGRPRRCGWLDLVAMRYSARVSGVTGICLMLLDVLAGLENLKVCVAYRYKGKQLETYPADAAVLAQVEPIYEDVEGFAQEVDECSRWADLPPQAQAYVRVIEEYVGVPVVLISVGPRRDQTLVR